MFPNDPGYEPAFADFDRYEAEQERSLSRLPKCTYCDEPIQSDELYVINDEFVCPECLIEHHRKWVEDCVD